MIARKAPQTYDVIGDCHVPRFKGVVLQSSTDGEDTIVFRTRWKPHQRASKVLEGGKISTWLTEAFQELWLLRQTPALIDDSPFSNLFIEKRLGSLNETSLQPRNVPEERVLMFSYGETDIWDIRHLYEGKRRFELSVKPNGIDRGPDDEGNVEEVGEETALNDVRGYCEPLFRAITMLQTAGYANIFLHEVPPSSQTALQYWPPARLRYKLVLLFNRLFREFCSESGVGFVSIWDQASDVGWRRPEFDADGLHMNPASALLSAQKLHELAAGRAT
jgi:hypothetical protein